MTENVFSKLKTREPGTLCMFRGRPEIRYGSARRGFGSSEFVFAYIVSLEIRRLRCAILKSG